MMVGPTLEVMKRFWQLRNAHGQGAIALFPGARPETIDSASNIIFLDVISDQNFRYYLVEIWCCNFF
jgi:hypothetical protein